MQKWELFKEVLKNTETSDQYNAIITAVEAYLSASNTSKVFEIRVDCSPKKLQEFSDDLWALCDGYGLL